MGAARAVVERVRRAAGADGAGESGLSALIGTHALHSAGDALIAVALAGTVFFSVPLGQARGRVALYLLLTLLPFSLLVPVAGPVLDHFRHGRRTVLAVTTAGRGLIAWSMVGATDGLALYPLALAVLVLSRAYGVARSAAIPRVRPPGVSLVAANARLNVAAVVSSSVAAGVGAGIARLVGVAWVLRLGSLVLLTAAVFALRLPGHVDEVRGHVDEVRGHVDEVRDRRLRGQRYRLLEAPAVVQRPLAAAVALRAQAGLLTIFLAFLLKREGAAPVVVVAVLGAAVAGQLLGTVLAGRLREGATARLTWAAMIGPGVACAVSAVVGGAGLEALAVGMSGMGSALSKFASDAALQTHVPRTSTSGAFARSETGLQLSWALAGAVALVLPSVAAVGFWVAAALPALGLVAGARVSAGRSLLPLRARGRARVPADAVGDGSPAGRADPPGPDRRDPERCDPDSRDPGHRDADRRDPERCDPDSRDPGHRDADRRDRERRDPGRPGTGRAATDPARDAGAPGPRGDDDAATRALRRAADATTALPLTGDEPQGGGPAEPGPGSRPWWVEP